MRNILALTGAAALALAACAGPMAGPRTAATGETILAQGTVVSVDQATREVVIAGPEGNRIAFVAGPEVRNLAQVAAGDTVTVGYHDSVVLSMAEADAPQGSVAGVSRAPEGARPSGGAVIATDVVVTVVSYDDKSGFAVFRTDDGVTHRATVPPELRTFAERAAPGSRVKVSLTEALAVSVTEN
ncbi:hypothetical protein [Amaricoccus solimangrovi]|uniref:DUF5666 domain-containing protein n=1 Tax=Amaricoccus solimangrovi TaxID=2589815 RepID=A0A501WR31_9RHOB|nr:hypothetical protein [Amaricoccus solimangrovi]TPE52233.1 hypothetical protein FJM51_07390 [Amaricoccus solimangrovi]